MPEKQINEALAGISKVPLWANELKYEHVFDRASNSLRETREIIGYNINNAMKIREEARASNDDSARFRCIACDCPFVLYSTQDRSGFFFRHKHYVDDCPIKDEKSLPPDVLRARKFNGKQESAAHAYMTALLHRLLQLDKRFENVIKEEVTKGDDGTEWKKPDVKGTFQGKKVAFEIQLSTESLDVIIKRRNFYKRNNTLLVWVFQAYSFDKARISDLDISYSNNNNVIVLDTESVEKSLKTNELHLWCHWRKVEHKDGKIVYSHADSIFNFDKLNKDFANSIIYHYDFVNEDKNSKQKLFTELWTKGNIGRYDDEKAAEILKNCYGISLDNKKNLARFIHLIWVARTGKSSGWNYTPESVFHKLFDRYKNLTYIYIAACAAYGRGLSDKNGKIEHKKKQILDSLAEKMPDAPSPYLPDPRFIAIARDVFPSLYTRLIDGLRNAAPHLQFCAY